MTRSNRGSTQPALSLSAEQMVLYVEAADQVLDRVFGPPTAPRRIDKTFNIKDLRSRTTADRILPDGVVLFSGAKRLPMYGASVPGPGVYRLRVHVKAIQSVRPVVMQVQGVKRGAYRGMSPGSMKCHPGKRLTER